LNSSLHINFQPLVVWAVSESADKNASNWVRIALLMMPQT